MYPIIIGPRPPPTLPQKFIAPDRVPAYLPPMSIADAQACGITRSLQKLASAIAPTAYTGSFIHVETTRNPLAPMKPIQAMMRRLLVTLMPDRVSRLPRAIE